MQIGRHAKLSGRPSLPSGRERGREDVAFAGHFVVRAEIGIRYPGSPGCSVMWGPNCAGLDRNEIIGSWSLSCATFHE